MTPTPWQLQLLAVLTLATIVAYISVRACM